MLARVLLVLVHGNPENAAVWGPLLSELRRVDAFTLSPPGFGVPVPEGFAATVDGYREWLVARLEQFREPVDLVGHDWGGAHVVQVAMERPDRSGAGRPTPLASTRPTTCGTSAPRCGSRKAQGRSRSRRSSVVHSSSASLWSPGSG
ncbi:alpha/beta fold hydrolase [Streptomyces umbrinus]